MVFEEAVFVESRFPGEGYFKTNPDSLPSLPFSFSSCIYVQWCTCRSDWLKFYLTTLAATMVLLLSLCCREIISYQTKQTCIETITLLHCQLHEAEKSCWYQTDIGCSLWNWHRLTFFRLCISSHAYILNRLHCDLLQTKKARKLETFSQVVVTLIDLRTNSRR